jgi:thiol-disulfide isomerase/thioredoxin
LSHENFDYVVLFFGADYCPHCKLFAPKVKESLQCFEKMNAKVIFVSNDRNEQAFGASCKKNSGIDVMPYDTSKTRAMRDLFGITTIPALMILDNKDYSSESPPVIGNGRHNLESDPYLRPSLGDKTTTRKWKSTFPQKTASSSNESMGSGGNSAIIQMSRSHTKCIWTNML